jgi:tetratricopeptide (TPR) repeat protein
VLFPDSSGFNYLQAFVLEGKGELAAAEAQLRAGIEKSGDQEGWYLLSDFYLNHGPREKLLQTYETILTQVDSTDALILNNYAYTLVEDPAETTPELLQKALIYSRRALEMDPDNGSYLDTRGWIYYQLGNLEAAREDLERALELDGRNPVLLEHLAAVVKNSDPGRARRLLAEAQRLRSRNSGGESEEAP